MEAVFGMLGALVGIGLFLFGFWFGKTVNEPKEVEKVELTAEEEKAIHEERQRLIADQKAFRELMSYNPDMAYGLAQSKE